MISWFKKHFIPHHGNDHKPHILRDANTRNIVIAVLLLEIFTFLLPTLIQINKTGGMAAVLPAILADLTNKERQTENLQTLTVNPILNKVAEMKAGDMASKGYFAHTSPEGKTPWYWLEQAGYSYQYAGENLAINFTDSKDVTKAWMESPTHKTNIVKDKYTEIGTGVATGIYEGREAVFVAQVYAKPLPKIINTPKVLPIINKTEASENTIKDEPKNILGAEIENNLEPINPPSDVSSVKNSTTLQKAIASPRNTSNVILLIVFGVIVLSLILYVVIKIKNHHLNLITNGLIVIAIIGAILLVNYYLSTHNMIILDSLDYSNEIK